MSDHGKGWANPGPAGLVALAMACFTFYAMFSGKVEHSALPLLGIWLLGGFVIQVIVGVMELLEGNVVGGNVFTFFSAFFMLVTGLECLYKFWAATKGITLDARIDGWAWTPLAIALLTWTPGYAKSPLMLFIAVLALDIAVPMIALKDLGIIAASTAPICGVFLLIAGILALYVAAAIVLNTSYGRQVIPMPGPLVK